MEEVVPKMARRRGSDADSQGGGESDLAEGVRRRCMLKIFAIVGAREQGTWVTGSVAPVLASESAHLFPGSPA